MSAVFSQIGPFLLAALVVYGIYRRFRRSFGQQPLRPVRMYVRIGTLIVIGCLLLPTALRSGGLVAAALSGVAGGVALALWGAARTQFVWIEKRLHYVPHTYTGIVVSLLFVGRLAYRVFQLYGQAHASPVDAATDPTLTPGAMVSSPLTLGLFSVLVGYYVCYYAVVLSKSKRIPAEDSAAPSPLDNSGTRA
jgi:hypothetical protein